MIGWWLSLAVVESGPHMLPPRRDGATRRRRRRGRFDRVLAIDGVPTEGQSTFDIVEVLEHSMRGALSLARAEGLSRARRGALSLSRAEGLSLARAEGLSLARARARWRFTRPPATLPPPTPRLPTPISDVPRSALFPPHLPSSLFGGKEGRSDLSPFSHHLPSSSAVRQRGVRRLAHSELRAQSDTSAGRGRGGRTASSRRRPRASGKAVECNGMQWNVQTASKRQL